jgi:hypothetical protein
MDWRIKMAKLDDLIAELANEYPNPITHDNGVDREMTDAEKAEWYEFAAKERIKADESNAAKLAQKSARLALLERLGITEAEAKVLLG